MKKNSAILTGATGFIGHRLMQRLVQSGWQVTSIVRDRSSTVNFPEDVRIYVDDSSRDENGARLCDAIRTAQPDVVFHLASLFLAAHTPADLPRLVESNVLFGARLLEAMKNAGATRFINTGTAWQHYEDKLDNPVNLYAATKSAFDSIVDYYAEAARISTITLKLYDTYGEGDLRAKLVHLLMKAATSQEHLAMSAGAQKIDLVHVDDVVRAFEMAGERLMHSKTSLHEAFTVSSGSPLPLKELVGVFEKATSTKLNIGWGERPYREREVMTPYSKGQPVPGWQPRINLTEGFKAVFDSVRK